MKITISNDCTPVQLNTLPLGMIFRNVVGGKAFIVTSPARGFGKEDGVAVRLLCNLGDDVHGEDYRVSGHTPVIRLYITDITLTEIPS